MIKLKRKNVLTAILVTMIAVFFASCDKEFSTLGVEVVGEGDFETKKASFDVIAYNRKLQSVRTDALPVYQLGVYDHPVYGRTKASIVSQLSLNSTNPTFGIYNALTELELLQENQANSGTNLVDDEMETVTSVYLNIPYFSNVVGDTDGDGAPNDIDPNPETADADADNDGVIVGLDTNDDDPETDYDNDGIKDKDEVDTSPYLEDTDGDGINDADDTSINCTQENFELDLIYGNRNEPFTIKVSELNDFLQDLDPNDNLESVKAYFSDDTFDVDATPLFEGVHQIETTNYAIEKGTGLEDDPDTSENESITCETIPAGIRIELSETALFQEFLDAEGSDELASAANFSNFIRGLMIEVEATNLMMLFNLNAAFVSVDYDYQRVINNEVITSKSSFNLNLSGGKKVNIFEEEEYPTEVTIDEQNPENLYLKGNAGTYVELNLFDENDSVLDTIPKSWLINEANLIFHLNEEDLSNYNTTTIPPRLYLYNLTDESTLIDYNFDFIGNDPNSTTKYPIFGGVFEDNEEGPSYKFRITEHISEIIRNGSENVKLGLFITSNIGNIISVKGINNNLEENLIPQASIISPFGTILHGGNENTTESNRLKLEIYYTKP